MERQKLLYWQSRVLPPGNHGSICQLHALAEALESEGMHVTPLVLADAVAVVATVDEFLEALRNLCLEVGVFSVSARDAVVTHSCTLLGFGETSVLLLRRKS